MRLVYNVIQRLVMFQKHRKKTENLVNLMPFIVFVIALLDDFGVDRIESSVLKNFRDSLSLRNKVDHR